MKKTSMKNKALAALGCVAIGVAGIAGGFALDNPATIVKEVPVEKIVYQDKIVTKEVPVEVIKTVQVTQSVDNGKLAQVLTYLEDKQIFEDAENIVRDIEREDAALDLAIEQIENELADELENEGLVEDERDVSIIKVYSDLDQYELLEADYENQEFLFKVEVKVLDDEADVKFKVFAEVEVQDGEAEIVSVYTEE
jgi:hypothetical protein